MAEVWGLAEISARTCPSPHHPPACLCAAVARTHGLPPPAPVLPPQVLLSDPQGGVLEGLVTNFFVVCGERGAGGARQGQRVRRLLTT